MALVMTRPTPHPKTGVFRVRVAIPAPLRETALRLYGRRSEFIESLKTKDRADAKRLAPAAVARLQEMIDAARNAAAGDRSAGARTATCCPRRGALPQRACDTFGDDPLTRRLANARRPTAIA